MRYDFTSLSRQKKNLEKIKCYRENDIFSKGKQGLHVYINVFTHTHN